MCIYVRVCMYVSLSLYISISIYPPISIYKSVYIYIYIYMYIYRVNQIEYILSGLFKTSMVALPFSTRVDCKRPTTLPPPSGM